VAGKGSVLRVHADLGPKLQMWLVGWLARRAPPLSSSYPPLHKLPKWCMIFFYYVSLFYSMGQSYLVIAKLLIAKLCSGALVQPVCWLPTQKCCRPHHQTMSWQLLPACSGGAPRRLFSKWLCMFCLLFLSLVNWLFCWERVIAELKPKSKK